ncbi:MAG TPA: diguanylate cyclase [Thermoanaerobaculia bacterium]|nr:diguanylate cyclase [Thermoanaerobaculia bacterium]
MTFAFALVLFAITAGLSWRAKSAQERWQRLVGVETRAIANLEELVRAQNAYRARGGDYRLVSQLLDNEALRAIDTGALRRRVVAFRTAMNDPTATPEEIDSDSMRVVAEAQRLIEERKREIARQLPALERESRAMMEAGLAVAWIIVILSFAAVQVTLRNVVRPLEDLARAADRIAAGDLTASAPVAGDLEIAKLGTAFNRMAEELKARARTDDLTALPNFRAFREHIDAEIDRAARYPESFGILVLDLDRFKKYNDTHGHLAGNEALQRVASVIRDTVRSVDFPARYGGEEFAVIVPEIDAAGLTAIAERIRANVESLQILTISIGGAIFPVDGKTVDALFQTADERLYTAKREGRNRVVIAPPVRSAHG